MAGRGWLSAIDLLPLEATPAIAWANAQLHERKRTQVDIYQEFYARLEELKREHRGELEFTIPSFPAFNRHSIKRATMSRRLQETSEIAGVLAKTFDAKASDDLTIIAAEAIKTLVFETLTAAGEANMVPKDTLHLASALFKAAQAQGVSTARRAKVEKEFGEKVEEALATVAKVKGMTAETAEAIKAQILGVRAA